MVLVSYKLANYVSILQTKFSYREGHEARRVGLETMPLDQHIKGGHGERRQCTRELWSYHLGTRHISNSSSVRQRSVNPSSIAGEYFLYLTSKRLACGLIHCRNAWFASTKL